MPSVDQSGNSLNPYVNGADLHPGPRLLRGHSGFLKTADCWLYMHADGDISAGGSHPGPIINWWPNELASLKLELPLANRDASPHGQTQADAAHAIRAALNFLDPAPDSATVRLFLCVFRAILGNTNFSASLSGNSPYLRTVAAVTQSFFGRGFAMRQLPAKLRFSTRHIEALAYAAKDALLTVDGASRASSEYDDTGIAQTLKARAAELVGAVGVYAMMVGSFVQWILATGAEAVRAQCIASRLKAREEFTSPHPRVVDNYAQLWATWCGFERFLEGRISIRVKPASAEARAVRGQHDAHHRPSRYTAAAGDSHSDSMQTPSHGRWASARSRRAGE
jgi:hypothetical protein